MRPGAEPGLALGKLSAGSGWPGQCFPVYSPLGICGAVLICPSRMLASGESNSAVLLQRSKELQKAT